MFLKEINEYWVLECVRAFLSDESFEMDLKEEKVILELY